MDAFQAGAALAKPLFQEVRTAGAATLRLVFGALILLAVNPCSNRGARLGFE